MGPIGRSIRRLEDGRLLRGEGRFVDDLQPEGCLHVALVRSPVASGRIESVAATFTAADLEGSCRPLSVHLTTPGALSPPRPILARDRVRFVGEMIAAMVAGSRYEAADAAERVQPEIEVLPAVVDRDAALVEGAPLVHDDVPGNLYYLGKRSWGDVGGAFERADVVVEAQAVHPRVSATDVGGGFGIKAQVYPEEVLLAWIALRMNAPVKWVETRSEHMQAASHARDQRIRLSAAVRKDGRILGLRATIHSSIGAYGIRPFGPLLDPMTCAGLVPGPYDIRDYEYESYAVATNKCPEGPYRGVGMVTAVLAHERLMDLVASRLGLDAADVRRVNFVTAPQMPYTTVTGHPYESGDYAAALEAALKASDYPALREQQRQARGEGRAVGIGIGSYVEFTGAGSSTFEGRGMADIPGTDTARVWLAEDGRVHVQTSCPAIGQGSHTTLAQVAAEGLGVEPESVVVEQTDTAMVGPGTGSFMSRGSVTAATSVFRAATLLRELQAENGELDVTVTYDAVQASHPYATHVCMVEVDRATGVVTVLRYVVAEDCGVLINPVIVEGQVAGGVTQGVGAALMEEVAYAEDGQLRSGTFLDYLIPSAGEAPTVQVEHLVTPSTVHELGTKGAGEGGTIGSTAAVANAVADALSLTDVTLPLTPDRLHGS
ncbi:MAG: xanthine dehydrogenase family protein [Chloroflexi bacterium]|nr:MAG: xanthine dehydrogenase family protein [Chloroflexota bacterium]